MEVGLQMQFVKEMKTHRLDNKASWKMRHEILITDWHPVRLNQLLNCHWGTRSKLKKQDRELIRFYAGFFAVPPAKGKRRVSLVLTLAPKQRAGDPDAFFKGLLDALVNCGLLVDDNRQWVELGTVEFVRGKTRQTRIVLEDL